MVYSGYYHEGTFVGAWVYKHDSVNEQFEGFESLDKFADNLVTFLTNTCGWRVKKVTW